MSKARIWLGIIVIGVLAILFLRTCTVDTVWKTRYSSDEQYSIYCYRYKYYLTYPAKGGATPVKMVLYDRIEKEVLFTKRLIDYDDFLHLSFNQTTLNGGKNATLKSLQYKLPRPIEFKEGYYYIKNELNN